MKKIVLEIPIKESEDINHVIVRMLKAANRFDTFIPMAKVAVEEVKTKPKLLPDKYLAIVEVKREGDKSNINLNIARNKLFESHEYLTALNRYSDKAIYSVNVTTYQTELVETGLDSVMSQEEIDQHYNYTIKIVEQDKIVKHMNGDSSSFIRGVLNGRVFIIPARMSNEELSLGDFQFKGEVEYPIKNFVRDSSELKVFKLFNKDVTTKILGASLKSKDKGFTNWIENRVMFEAYKYKEYMKKKGEEFDDTDSLVQISSILIGNKDSDYTGFRTFEDDEKMIIRRIPEISSSDELKTILYHVVRAYPNDNIHKKLQSSEGFLEEVIAELYKHHSRRFIRMLGPNFISFYSSDIANILDPIMSTGFNNHTTPEFKIGRILHYASMFNLVTDEELESYKFLEELSNIDDLAKTFLKYVHVYLFKDRYYNTNGRKPKGALKSLNEEKKRLAQNLLHDISDMFRKFSQDYMDKLMPFIDLVMKEMVIIKEFSQIMHLYSPNYVKDEEYDMKMAEVILRAIDNTLKSKSHLTARAIIKSKFFFYGYGNIFEMSVIDKFPDIEIAYVENKL